MRCVSRHFRRRHTEFAASRLLQIMWRLFDGLPSLFNSAEASARALAAATAAWTAALIMPATATATMTAMASPTRSPERPAPGHC